MCTPIAIELDGKVFASLTDNQNNICKLIDPYQNIKATLRRSKVPGVIFPKELTQRQVSFTLGKGIMLLSKPAG